MSKLELEFWQLWQLISDINLQVQVYNVLLVHVTHTLADLSHVRDTVLLCEVVLLLHETVKQFSATQPESMDQNI